MSAFYVLAQGDDADGADFVPVRSPNNLDTSVNSLMVPSSPGEGTTKRH